MILDLTPFAHPRTFQSLIEFSFANRGNKTFVSFFQDDSSPAPDHAISYLKPMLCQPVLLV